MKEKKVYKIVEVYEVEEFDTEEDQEEIPSTKKGLSDEWTRATFIVREDLLQRLKDLAFTNRTKIKDELDNALEQYLSDKKIISREEK